MKKILVLLAILSMPMIHTQEVHFNVRTITYNGYFAPKHCLAIWVSSRGTAYYRTLKVMAQFPLYGQYLCKWQAFSNQHTGDAITGASLNAHTAHYVIWDCKDKDGNEVPDGEYKIRVEFTEDNSCRRNADFLFVKDDTSKVINYPDETVFKDIRLNYVAPPNSIKDNVELIHHTSLPSTARLFDCSGKVVTVQDPAPGFYLLSDDTHKSFRKVMITW